MKTIAHSKPSIGPEEAKAAADVLLSGQLVQGKECRLFEEELAQKLERHFAVVTANGHVALEIYLESLSLSSDSQVIVPSYACAALRHSPTSAVTRPQDRPFD